MNLEISFFLSFKKLNSAEYKKKKLNAEYFRNTKERRTAKPKI